MLRWRASLVRVVSAAGLLLLVVGGTALPETPSGSSQSLRGFFLVAAPSLVDPNFDHTVVYLVEHDPSGAFGIVVNRQLGAGPLDKFMAGFGLPADDVDGEITLFAGGPVKSELGFMLHSPDYEDETTRVISPSVSMSTNVTILASIARNKTPRRFLFVFGYSGWGPGQLEQELARKDWLVVPGDASLIFDGGSDAEKWSRARKAAGITL